MLFKPLLFGFCTRMIRILRLFEYDLTIVLYCICESRLFCAEILIRILMRPENSEEILNFIFNGFCSVGPNDQRKTPVFVLLVMTFELKFPV